MGLVANFIQKNFENRLRFDKVTEHLKVGTFLRLSVVTVENCITYNVLNIAITDDIELP